MSLVSSPHVPPTRSPTSVSTLGWQEHSTAPGGGGDMVALIVFSGPGDRADGIAAYMRALGWRVVEIDILVGGAAHDMANPSTAATLIARVATGEFAVVFLAPPCSSYSVAHRPKLRSAAQPEGVTPIPAAWAAYLAKHNRMTAAAFDIVSAARSSGAHVM
eukprot:CAMPEP_0174730922 /NCGR_PEP_ID=MMETSP1094-20130205/56516_1 /TAXON_ID=156173 /ORGANISM="Chrysochromulina brevifilum, Strain UTEX LB 985" /LENGTH=160 /DNA_ID=CAMNT_0015933241 /DNA_START=131 /DNA_END=610 /DNA_ORIENTATION=+